MAQKMNCWQYKKCGREPGGSKASELGVCGAATEKRTNGTNNGRNGGRACWVVSGTLCGGAVQGTFAHKMSNCMQCDFYKLVRKEEGAQFVSSTKLLPLLGIRIL